MTDQIDFILSQWNKEKPDLDVIPMAIIGRINRLAQHLSREMEKTFAEHNLNTASFDVLATLRRSGEPYCLSPGVLLKTMMVTSGTMTNRIDQLVKRGLVTRKSSSNDARSFDIKLTAKGLRLIDTVIEDHVATQKRLVSGLNERDVKMLNRVLSGFLQGFEEGVGRLL